MTHKKVYDIFERLFPFIANSTKEWFECGRNCIRIRCSLYNEELVFSYYSKKNWKLEPLDNFISSMNRKEKK